MAILIKYKCNTPYINVSNHDIHAWFEFYPMIAAFKHSVNN